MIIHIKLILFVIFTIEVLKRFYLFSKFKNIKIFCLKLFRLINLRKVSDKWKEKALFRYSKDIFILSIKIFFILILIFLFYVILIHLDELTRNYFFSIIGFTEISVLTLLYYKIRNYKK